MTSTHRYRHSRAAGVWQRLPYGPAPAGRPWTQAAGRARHALRHGVVGVQPLLVTSLLLAVALGGRGV